MKRPKFKDKYHLEILQGEGIFLLAERESFVLEGDSLFHMAPLIDGLHSVDEIVAAVSPWVTQQEALSAFDVLQRNGHLVEADPVMPQTLAAFWSEFDVDTRAIPTFLANCPVSVSAFGNVNPTLLRQALSDTGMVVSTHGVIHIAIVDDYQRPELAMLNAECLDQKTPLLLIKPVGVRLWIGPLILPGRTACWKCLEIRIRANREVESYVEAKSGRPVPFPVARVHTKLGELQAISVAVTQLLRWLITGSNPELESHLLVADQVEFSYTSHHVLRLPHCLACGNPELGTNAGNPILLKNHAATPQTNSGIRLQSAEATFERLKHHISPYTGIVNSVMPAIWHGVGPIRTYISGHNFALKSDQLSFLKEGLRTNSSGKGWTDAQAKTSALCEALERYSGVFQGNEPQIENSFSNLGSDAVDPRSCMLYSDKQYQEREKWLARESRFQIVPLPFEEQQKIMWTPLWSLSDKRVRYLPTSYLYYNFPYKNDQFFCWADSNGAAAGCTLEEAILQGLLELIERDAVALWWYNRRQPSGVDLDSFDDNHIAQMQDFYEKIGRELWVLDLTADLGVPVFVAISRRKNGPHEDIMMGFGAHLDTRIALTRALTELNQFIPALLNVGADGQTQYILGDKDALKWWTTATLENQPYLLPNKLTKKLNAKDLPSFTRCSSIANHLDQAIMLVENKGLEILVLDQTRADVGLPVVKVVVPGLRHFWARLAPGRLYDVPVELGWSKTPTKEDDLNPISMFL